jgi:PKD repeat protein
MAARRAVGSLAAKATLLAVLLTLSTYAALAAESRVAAPPALDGTGTLPLAHTASVRDAGLPGAPAPAGHPLPARGVSALHPSAVRPHPDSAPGDALQAAARDLAAGTGPSGLAPLHCSTVGGQSATCALARSGPHPAAYTKPYGFQTTSPVAGVTPPKLVGGVMTWYPPLGAVILFGGEGELTDVPLNVTWEYLGGVWYNLTSPAAPPARSFAAMAWDASLSALVLAGGLSATGAALEDTWEFYYGAWTNVTSTAYALTAGGPGLYAPSMAQNGTNGVVLFGGCWGTSCSTLNYYTFFFSVYNGVCPATGTPCWWYIPSMATPAGRYYTTLVTDGTDGYDYLYGGLGTTGVFNDTWEYTPTTYTWTNISISSIGAGGFYPGTGMFGMTMFFDPDTGAVFMYGGEDQYDAFIGTLWALSAGLWTSIAGLNFVQPGWAMSFIPIASTPFVVYPPVMLGSVNQSLGVSNLTWVFEPGLVTNANAIPTTVETNATVNLFANVTGGSCDDSFYYGQCYGTWTFGNGGTESGQNITTTYTHAGHYTATLEGYDSYGVSNFTPVSITVTTYTVGVSAAPTTVTEGTAVVFIATPSGGTPAYNYTWHLSDGTVAWDSGTSHAFDTPGTMWGNVTVRDASGTVVNASASVYVVPPVAGSISATPSAGVDLGHSITFTALGSGGESPYNYTWTVGTSTGYGPNFVYTPTTTGLLGADVTIKDSFDQTTIKSITVTVAPALGAAISATPSSPTTGETVTFASGQSGGIEPYTYAWQFGDGHSSALASPTHSYGSAGTYVVNLWVNDSGGGSVHSVLSITVSSSPSSGLGGTVAGLALWEWLAIVVVIVVIVAAALLAMRRRGRGSAPQATPPPPPGAQPPPPGPEGPPPGAT